MLTSLQSTPPVSPVPMCTSVKTIVVKAFQLAPFPSAGVIFSVWSSVFAAYDYNFTGKYSSLAFGLLFTTLSLDAIHRYQDKLASGWMTKKVKEKIALAPQAKENLKAFSDSSNDFNNVYSEITRLSQDSCIDKVHNAVAQFMFPALSSVANLTLSLFFWDNGIYQCGPIALTAAALFALAQIQCAFELSQMKNELKNRVRSGISLQEKKLSDKKDLKLIAIIKNQFPYMYSLAKDKLNEPILHGNSAQIAIDKTPIDENESKEEFELVG